MTAPPLRASFILPKWADLTHFSKLLSLVRARVSVISPALGRPGSFLLMYLPSGELAFISMVSCSILRPDTSWMCLMTTPSISRPNEWPTGPFRSGRAMASTSWLSLGQGGAARELRQPEDHELGRLHRCHADLADELAGVDDLGRVRLVVTLDVEGFVGREPEQRALAPFVGEEGRDGAPDPGPEGVVVRLELDPLRAVQDRLLEVVEEP